MICTNCIFIFESRSLNLILMFYRKATIFRKCLMLIILINMKPLNFYAHILGL